MPSPQPVRPWVAEMDLGLQGRTALVCASTQGLGRACAEALATEGAQVVVNGRDADRTAEAVKSIIEATGATGRVSGVAADLDTADGRHSLLAACPDPDIVVTNNAGPPPAVFTDVSPAAWLAALEANMLSAIAVVQGVLPGMQDRGFGRIVAITSAMVKSPNAFMTPSVGARAGLTGVLKAVAREVASDGVTINCLLPERIDTGRQRQMAELAVSFRGITLDEAYAEIAATIPAGRLGRPEEVAAACAFLCSDRAGFITGQNLQLDGGAYEGLI